MKPSRLLLKIVLINSIFCQSSIAKFSFGSIKSYFFSKPNNEEVIQKEFPVDKQVSLHLKNRSGDITISQWEQNAIQMKATKLAYKEEELSALSVQTTKTEKKVLIKTSIADEKTDGRVNYELLVPRGTKVNVATKEGSINIDKLDAQIKVKTEQGNISISNTKNLVYAATASGSINIENVLGNVWATTEHGNISIDKASKNLVAKTKKGAICTTCSTVDALNKISLMAESGNIVLSIPKETNAKIEAATKKGKLTCEHFVTINPQTVQLNKKTWNKMKKEVNGTIGSGDATIKISTGSGNIKILETT